MDVSKTTLIAMRSSLSLSLVRFAIVITTFASTLLAYA